VRSSAGIATEGSVPRASAGSRGVASGAKAGCGATGRAGLNPWPGEVRGPGTTLGGMRIVALASGSGGETMAAVSSGGGMASGSSAALARVGAPCRP
jgi:hypothetical protein